MAGRAARLRFSRRGAWGRDYRAAWQGAKPLEQQLLLLIAQGNIEPYSAATRRQLAQAPGLPDVSVSAVQGAIRRLSRRGLLTKRLDRGARGGYAIDDPNLGAWLHQRANQ